MEKNQTIVKFNGVGVTAEVIARQSVDDFLLTALGIFFLNYKLADRETLCRELHRICCEKVGKPDEGKQKEETTESSPTKEPKQSKSKGRGK